MQGPASVGGQAPHEPEQVFESLVQMPPVQV
jgi:hypothetical protein